MKQNYLVGIDLGTQGTKAALFDEHLQMVSTAFEPSRLVSPEPGVVWQEADDLYASVVHTIRTLVDESGIHPSDIAGIGMDGQMAGIMGISSDGSASTYYDSWLDMRCGPYADRMNDCMGKRIIELSGGAASYTHGSKILWWMHEQPDVYQRTAKFVLPHAYLVGRMTGLTADEAYCDYTHLHFSNFADNSHCRWSEEILRAFDVSVDKMPRIVSPFSVVGYTTEGFAQLSGTVSGIPVVAGCGDTAAGTFGSGLFDSGMVMDIAGTASVLCSVVDSYVPDVAHETLTMMRSPVEGLFLPLAYVNGGGQCIRWCRDTLHASYDDLTEEAQQCPAGSDGLIFVPHFSGRVLPNNPNLKGCYLGLDFIHTRGHLYRAVLESIAYEYRYYLQVLRQLHPEYAFDRMITMGGGAKSPLFNQIKADVLGVTVETFEMAETGLVGSAAIAGVGVGLLDGFRRPIAAITKKGKEFAPDMQRHVAYEKPAQKYLYALDKATEYFRGEKDVDGK